MRWRPGYAPDPAGGAYDPQAPSWSKGRESKRKGGGEERYEKEIGEVGKGKEGEGGEGSRGWKGKVGAWPPALAPRSTSDAAAV